MKKFLITVNGQKYNVEVESLDEEDQLKNQPYISGGYQPNYLLEKLRTHHDWETLHHPVANKTNAAHNAIPGTVLSPVNGTVIEVKIKPGQQITTGDVAFVVEAMKMKTNIFPSSDGVVKSIEVNVGDAIEQGQILIHFQ